MLLSFVGQKMQSRKNFRRVMRKAETPEAWHTLNIRRTLGHGTNDWGVAEIDYFRVTLAQMIGAWQK